MTNFRTDKDADGILTLTWDMPGRSMNVLSQESIAELDSHVTAAIADATVKGVVLTSGKPAFVAGADLAMMSGITASAAAPGKSKEQSAKEIFDWVMTLNTNFRKDGKRRQAVRRGDQRHGHGRRARGLPRLPLPRLRR